MSRNGSGIYSLPSIYHANTGDLIVADQHNTPLEDIRDDLNAARPVVAGGTGATTASGARTNLSVYSQSEVNSGTVKRIATTTAHKALDTGIYSAVYNAEKYKVFAWETGDYSADVAADPGELNYIPADGVSSSLGCWVAITGDGNAVRPISGGGTGASTASGALTNLGGMAAATYDPNHVVNDAFDQDNMVDGTTNKNYTATEQTKLAGIEAGADVTDAANVTAAGAAMTANNLSDLANADTALTNLGGGASGTPVFKAANTAALTTALAGAVDDNAVNTASNLHNRLIDLPNVKDSAFGAVGDGVTTPARDDTAALQAALDSNTVPLLPGGRYRITKPLVVDPARNRNTGFVGLYSSPSRYPATQQTGGPAWTGEQEIVIYYDGPAAADMTSTSTSSVAIGTGPKSFTTGTGKAYSVGNSIRITDDAAPTTNWMQGDITAYDSGTGALTVNVTNIGGSGTKTAWTLKVWTAVLIASSEPIAIEPASNFDNTVWGLKLHGITFDANSKADFGVYCARVQDIDFYRNKYRGANEAGLCINGTYSGATFLDHAYLNPGLGIAVGDADSRWGWTVNFHVNAFTMYSPHAEGNGSDSTYRQSDVTLRRRGCGILWAPYRNCTLHSPVVENNFGANLVFYPKSVGNFVYGIYGELGCAYAPGGAGTDAITLGYGTDNIGVLFVGAAGGASLSCGMRGGGVGGNDIFLSGTEPSNSRPESGFLIDSIYLIGGITASWANWRAINCAAEAGTISGTSPASPLAAPAGIAFGYGTSTPVMKYAEGNHTAALRGLSVAGTGWAYTINAFSYVKIGKLVTMSGRIEPSTIGTGASGQVIFTLPFAAGGGNNYQTPAVIKVGNGPSTVSCLGDVSNNTTDLYLYKKTAAAASDSALLVSDLTAGSTVIDISVTYIAAS